MAPMVADALNTRIAVPAGVATIGTKTDRLAVQLSSRGVQAKWYMDETPQRKVDVGPFKIDATEVTNSEYKKMKPGQVFPANLAEHPVVNIRWEEADAYCKSVGGGLPTEAQWERVARGDEGYIYPWGNEFDGAKVVYMDNLSDDSKLKVGSFEQETSGVNLLGGTQRVGSRKTGKSPFGAYDMAGNVWEWVDGWYNKEKGLRTLKGGSWLSPQASVRSATRLGDDGIGVYNDYGFRCAYDDN